MKSNIPTDLLDQLYGTWTFVSQREADLGYYKAKAYLVVHFMPDPSQTLGCSMDNCSEFQNQLCQEGGSTCINTVTAQSEWSDVAALYSFGFQVDNGFAIKSHIRQSTADWLGPYNVILADSPKKKQDEADAMTDADHTMDDLADESLYVSRLVQTASSQYLKAPPQCSIVSDQNFGVYAGLDAIEHSIQTQTDYPSDLQQDPYSQYLKTCDNGNLQAVLPRFTIREKVVGSNISNNNATKAPPPLDFALRYPVLSLPDPSNKLENWWPTLQKRFKGNLVQGPYCFDGQLKAYTIDLNFAKQGQDASWQFVKGCVDGLPCWPNNNDTPSNGGGGGGGNHHPAIPDAISSTIIRWINQYLGAMGLIALLVVLVISLICNLRLCCKVRTKRRQLRQQQQQQQQQQAQSNGEAAGGASVPMAATRRQRRPSTRTTAGGSVSRSNDGPVIAAQSRRPPPSQSRQTPAQPRSSQILSPSRLMMIMRKREPVSKLHVPLLQQQQQQQQQQKRSNSEEDDDSNSNAPPCIARKTDPSTTTTTTNTTTTTSLQESTTKAVKIAESKTTASLNVDPLRKEEEDNLATTKNAV